MSQNLNDHFEDKYFGIVELAKRLQMIKDHFSCKEAEKNYRKFFCAKCDKEYTLPLDVGSCRVCGTVETAPA